MCDECSFSREAVGKDWETYAELEFYVREALTLSTEGFLTEDCGCVFYRECWQCCYLRGGCIDPERHYFDTDWHENLVIKCNRHLRRRNSYYGARAYRKRQREKYRRLFAKEVTHEAEPVAS